jgi:hypothetical protein
MEIVLILIAITVVGGALVWDYAAQTQHVSRTRGAWMAADRAVTIPPIRTICHGHYPPGPMTERIVGALGVVDDALTFTGQRADTFDFAAPLGAIRWVGLRTVVKRSWNRRVEWPELVIHAELAAGWRVYTFTEGPITALAGRVAEIAGLDLHQIGERFEDFGPLPAIYLVEDAAGQWQRITDLAVDLETLPDTWDGLDYTLYLAPDRLLYDWRTAIPLAGIQRVDVYAQRGASKFNPFDLPLLRIVYTDAAGARQVAGFLVANAGDWAGVLENLIAVPVAHHAGRDA